MVASLARLAANFVKDQVAPFVFKSGSNLEPGDGRGLIKNICFWAAKQITLHRAGSSICGRALRRFLGNTAAKINLREFGEVIHARRGGALFAQYSNYRIFAEVLGDEIVGTYAPLING